MSKIRESLKNLVISAETFKQILLNREFKDLLTLFPRMKDEERGYYIDEAIDQNVPLGEVKDLADIGTKIYSRLFTSELVEFAQPDEYEAVANTLDTLNFDADLIFMGSSLNAPDSDYSLVVSTANQDNMPLLVHLSFKEVNDI